MTFSLEEDIDLAFSRLSASVKSIIKDVNFSTLQSAAIERAKSPKMIQKSSEIVPTIKAATSFQDLCTLLADTPYWNFLDIRMMEAMAAASLIPAAQHSVENFKQTFFRMTLAEAAPYFPIIPQKSTHSAMTEQLDKDPSKMTISELHKHRFFLETELLQTGPDSITICRIVIGSVTITWQIHVDHVYKAYCSLKKKQSQLPPQGIMALSVHEAVMFEGLPFVWCGQEIKQIGPIEPLPQQVQHKPITLPEGLQWVSFDSTGVINNNFNRERIQWITSHPFSLTVKDNWCFAIESNAIDKYILWSLLYVQIGGMTLKMVCLLFRLHASPYIANLMLKEMYRRVNLHGISHSLICSFDDIILKPIVNFTQWEYNFKYSNVPLPHSPTTPGWRAMTSKDIPVALALTNKYTSQFEIRQVFQSEEEFSHYFMYPMIENCMHTYVVEDPVTGDITDVAGFKPFRSEDGSKFGASATILVAATTPARQLFIDLLVCAKQTKIYSLVTLQFGLTNDVFENLNMTRLNFHCHLLNYQYPEVNENQVCLFCYLQ